MGILTGASALGIMEVLLVLSLGAFKITLIGLKSLRKNKASPKKRENKAIKTRKGIARYNEDSSDGTEPATSIDMMTSVESSDIADISKNPSVVSEDSTATDVSNNTSVVSEESANVMDMIKNTSLISEDSAYATDMSFNTAAASGMEPDRRFVRQAALASFGVSVTSECG